MAKFSRGNILSLLIVSTNYGLIWLLCVPKPQFWPSLTVSLRDEFNRNKETETSKNEQTPKTDGRSIKYRNTGNGII